MIYVISGTALVSAVVHGLLLVIASQDFALRSLSALYLSFGMALELLSGFSVNCTLNLASWGGKKKETGDPVTVLCSGAAQCFDCAD